MDVVREGGPLLGAEVGALLGATFVLIIARKLSEPAALGVGVALGLDRPSLPILEMASTFGGRFMIVVEGWQGGKVTLRSTVYAYCFHWRRILSTTRRHESVGIVVGLVYLPRVLELSGDRRRKGGCGMAPRTVRGSLAVPEDPACVLGKCEQRRFD